MLYGAAPIADWVVRAWFDLVGPEHFMFSYGGTERFGIVSCNGVEWLDHPGTVGLPQGCELRILGEDGTELPPGEVGEIFLRSIGARPDRGVRGCGAGEEHRRRVLVSYGDMGWVDDDGYLFIADRRVDMIVSGGANVWPAEVEAALSEHPEVRDAVVIGIADPEWGRRVHAIVEPADPANPPGADDLRAHCRERLTPYKVPKTFEIWLEGPLRTAAGKVNRSALVAEREPRRSNRRSSRTNRRGSGGLGRRMCSWEMRREQRAGTVVHRARVIGAAARRDHRLEVDEHPLVHAHRAVEPHRVVEARPTERRVVGRAP